ncbi:unnamed protein product [Nippostrongylus brasiliensis]|uniref:CCHC-type domain-containing protein n=1 Tax=Nippostrongylus brasiliensis TaxID=27835 RepID=A0A0N4Y9A3_NIPBR|nr:unnamed protein product [Nippostrongylus brasiliensis]
MAQQDQKIGNSIAKKRTEQQRLRRIIDEEEACLKDASEQKRKYRQLAQENDVLLDQVQSHQHKTEAQQRQEEIEDLDGTVEVEIAEGNKGAVEERREVYVLGDDVQEARPAVQHHNQRREIDDRERRSIEREVRRLEREIRGLEDARRAIPPRVLTEVSRGIHPDMRCVFCGRSGQHFSDSCPFVRDVNERRQIITRRRRCFRCLEHCERRGFCSFQSRRCIYCNRAVGTALQEARLDQGKHHAALCHVPEQREQVWVREEQLRDQIAELQQQLRQH